MNSYDTTLEGDTMNIFVATQPIFNKKLNVFGYEVLHRSNANNAYNHENPDVASSEVLINTFEVVGIERLTDGKPAFVHFTNKILEKNVTALFPNDQIMIQIPESIKNEYLLVYELEELSKRGYFLVFDDYILEPEYQRFLPLANIIRVDLKNADPKKIKEIKTKYRKIHFLAEKVEAQWEFDRAVDLGFDLFQGYFFAKPVMHKQKTLQPIKSNYFSLLQEVTKPIFDLDAVVKILETDLALSYKVLKLANTVEFSFRKEISSLKHAIVALGQDKVKKILTVLSMANLNESKPHELVKLSLVRAKMLEEVVVSCNLDFDTYKVFILGLFSTLDAMLDISMEDALKKINIDSDIYEALVEKSGPYNALLKLVMLYENMQVEELKNTCDIIGIQYNNMTNSYLLSLDWYKKILSNAL
jgi:EAL and modified HD-GYP domain-containing signal transduction protein